MKKTQRRKIDLLVLSDIHLGTYGCRAKELLNYLKTVSPKVLILNGDIIDIWQFNKRYFPVAHMKVIKHFTSILSQGTKVYYITGNHDEMLRKFEGFSLGSFEIVNKLVLNLNGKRAWFFHGDVFDVFMQYSKWLAKLGGKGYDLLILVNTLVNWISQQFGRGRLSISKRVKNSVKGAVKYINNFEETVAEMATFKKYDYVICGHIHQPQMRRLKDKNGQSVMYLNSGDWIENLSALEYKNNEWYIYQYNNDPLAQSLSDNINPIENELAKVEFNNKQLFNDLLDEFQFDAPPDKEKEENKAD